MRLYIWSVYGYAILSSPGVCLHVIIRCIIASRVMFSISTFGLSDTRQLNAGLGNTVCAGSHRPCGLLSQVHRSAHCRPDDHSHRTVYRTVCLATLWAALGNSFSVSVTPSERRSLFCGTLSSYFMQHDTIWVLDTRNNHILSYTFESRYATCVWWYYALFFSPYLNSRNRVMIFWWLNN